jgi:hypothetical protein
LKRTGIEERRYSEPGVATSDLAVPAAEDAIRRAGITKKDIDMILFATLSPDAAFPGDPVGRKMHGPSPPVNHSGSLCEPITPESRVASRVFWRCVAIFVASSRQIG